MNDRFVGEEIRPVAEALEASGAAPGEPAFPRAFTWQGETVRTVEVLRRWKSTGPCRHGSGERYVRRHWYEIRTEDNRRMTIYFDRQAQGRSLRKRWWLFTVND